MTPVQWVTPTGTSTSHAVWVVNHGRVLSWCLDIHRSEKSIRPRSGSDLVCRTCWDATSQGRAA